MDRATEAIDLLDLFSSAEAIDALPITVTRLANLVADDDHDFRDIVEVVSLDPALTALLLRRANTAAHRGRMQITTVRDAAMRLGTGSLLSMALAGSVHNRMSRALPSYGLAEGELWKQAVAAALSTDLIRFRATVTVPAEASTAALLHDFGKIVLSQHLGGHVMEMPERAAASGERDLLSAERAVFGVDHADIGGVIAQRWKLPHTIVDAIVHHHENDPSLPPMVAAVSLAHAMVPDVLATGEEAYFCREAPARVLVADSHGALVESLGLDVDGYPALLGDARRRYAELAERFEVR